MSRVVRLGAFMVVAFVIFFGGVFWIAGKQFLFTSTYRLGADFQNVTGLLEGAEVRVGGIHQGTVERIDLPRHPGEKVRVVMKLKRATREVVKKDSVAVVRAEGLIG